MPRLDFPLGEQRKLLSRIETKLRLDAEALAEVCRVHPRTFRDWKREKYKLPEEILRDLCQRSGVAFPKAKILPDYWSTKKAGQLGALARYRLHGNPGTVEGRRKAGRLLTEWIRSNPELAKQKGVVIAKKIKHPSPSHLLAEFVGVLIGDGGIRNGLQVSIAFNRAKELAYAAWLQRVVTKLFGLKSAVLLEKDNYGGSVIISSVRLVQFLEETAGLRSGNKLRNGLDVPKWIWERRSYQVACLRGLMDTDGGPFIHRYQVNGKWYAYPKLAFCSMSDALLQSVFQLFVGLGFHPRLAKNHQVFIDRVEEARRFYRVVGSRHKRHLALINQSTQTSVNRMERWRSPADRSFLLRS